MKKNILMVLPIALCAFAMCCSCSSATKTDTQETDSVEQIDSPIEEDLSSEDAQEEDAQEEAVITPLAKIMGDENDWITIQTYEDEWPTYVNKNATMTSDGALGEVLFDMSRENRYRSDGNRFLDDDAHRGWIKREFGLRQTPFYCIEKRRHMYWNDYILVSSEFYNKDGELIKKDTSGGVYDILGEYQETIRDKIKELVQQ